MSEAELQKKLSSWRQAFHKYPELSGEEKSTREKIVKFLAEQNIEFQTFNKHYGICGTIEGALAGPTIALRADMDALPITEENDVLYKSLNEGQMHACGHDGHMAILMGVACLLQKNRHQLAGRVKLVFQPAEELSPIGGSKTMIEEGILQDVEAIFGLHLWPEVPMGKIAVKTGALMAASDRFKINIVGKSAHAAQPHNGIDAITMSADVIQGLNHIISRQIDPVEVATVSIGKVTGGERYNVVAKEVKLEGTVRTLNENIRVKIPKYIENILKGIAESQGGSYNLDYQRGYPALINSKKATEIVIAAGKKVIGSANVDTQIKPVLGAEDFANYLEKVSGAFFFLGCAKSGNKVPVLHNSKFDIDEKSLLIGAKILYEVVLLSLEAYKVKGGE